MQKGLSTSVDQTLPVVLIGRNAGGQFFGEHTTTLRVSCHGCTLRSKHFVLKGTQVTLEVPGPDPQLAPQSVPVRVLGSRKPEKKGDPFELDLEFETPGDIWGIAFPPADWREFPPPGGAPAPVSGEHVSPVKEQPANLFYYLPPPRVEKVRVVPVPPREEESARPTFSAPMHIPEVRRPEEGDATPVPHVTVNPSAPAAALEDSLPARITTLVDEAIAAALRRLEEAAATTRQKLREDLRAEREQVMQAVSRFLDERQKEATPPLHQEVETKTARDGGALEQRLAELEEKLRTVASQAQQSVDQASEAVAAYQARLAEQADALVAAASRRIERAADEALSSSSAELAKQFERQLATQLKGAKLDEKVQELASLQRQLDQQMQEARAQLQQTASQSVEALTNSSAELARKFDRELAAKLGSIKLDEKVQELASLQRQLDQQMHEAQERLQEAASQFLREAEARLTEQLGKAENEANTAIRGTLEKQLEEFRAKSADVTLLTFESLHRSGEWHEKKFQSSVQEVVEKTTGQFEKALQSQGGEASRIFAADLDRLTRSYAAQAHALAEEGTNQLLQRYRRQVEADAKSTEAAFLEAIRKAAEEFSKHLQEAAQVALEEARVQLGEVRQEISVESASQAAQRLAEFERQLVERASIVADKARGKFDTLLSSTAQHMDALLQGKTRAWQQASEREAEASITRVRQRLEEAANSCLVVSAATLAQGSQKLLQELAASLDEEVRRIAAQAFAKFAEVLKVTSAHPPDAVPKKDS